MGLIETYKTDYNIEDIILRGYEFRKHRGKQISHKYYIVIYNDGTELDVYIPHYFESIGFNRRMVKLLEDDKIIKRNKKIKKILNGRYS